MGNSSSVLDSVTSFEDINDIQKALQASPDPTDVDVIKAFHACCYVSTTCQRLQCILEMFLKHGVDVNATDPTTQWTILHHVFASQKTFVLPYLLAAGAKHSRDVNGLSPSDYLPKSKRDHFVRIYMQQCDDVVVPTAMTPAGESCEVQMVHDWKRDTHELGELLHVKCKGTAGYVQLIYHENDSIDSLQEEAVFDQFINVEGGERTLSFSTSHLPEMAVVHVLYVACDKQMMHRRIQATDGPLRMQANVEKYVFTVNGEAFHHGNPILDGMVFPTMREFQQFMKMLKSDKLQSVAYVDDSINNQLDDTTNDTTPSQHPGSPEKRHPNGGKASLEPTELQLESNQQEVESPTCSSLVAP
ncbi:hypothetical protein H310_05792 [Aphanomyces invadans]|uniref:Uncharacterized protein n=1 Tax=Aphanomyces invadans TaxID=157072 RepID=A0A024U9D4_9STRA|nr:hypothetical protein H310_05792 [Aphanomyces invadans]ETW02233.1 hypothetical protein H310_05792 [Aphanomyces invadans]|eukprot:XP_008868838.1 hypothetical protein H310_05792 [Aphanomyces invadans]